MEGDKNSEEFKGIIPRSFEHIFKTIRGTASTQFFVSASMIEIYNEQVKDLVSKSDAKLELKSDPKSGVYVKDLSHNEVKSEADCYKLLTEGSKSRHVTATSMNDTSSRSHCIFS